jgi:hypothetical protein
MQSTDAELFENAERNTEAYYWMADKANEGRVWQAGINTWAALVDGGVTYRDSRYAAVRAAMGARG